MGNNQELRLMIELHVTDCEGVEETATVSRTFEPHDLDAQRAWGRDVRARWPRADIVMVHGLPGRTLPESGRHTL
jgi:hypothetical protein